MYYNSHVVKFSQIFFTTQLLLGIVTFIFRLNLLSWYRIELQLSDIYIFVVSLVYVKVTLTYCKDILKGIFRVITLSNK